MHLCMGVGVCGVSGELGLAGWSLGSLCVFLLVCCGLVVVLCFVVVFLLVLCRFFSCVVWYIARERCVYIMLNEKSHVDLDLVFLCFFYFVLLLYVGLSLLCVV